MWPLLVDTSTVWPIVLHGFDHTQNNHRSQISQRKDLLWKYNNSHIDGKHLEGDVVFGMGIICLTKRDVDNRYAIL